jgi:hypothetical protein
VTTVQLTFMTDRGLADLVAQCLTDNTPAACATWEPASVERYPAVLDTGGQCRLMVGIAAKAVLWRTMWRDNRAGARRSSRRRR